MGWSYGASHCLGQLLYIIGSLVLLFHQLVWQKSNSEYFVLTTEQGTTEQTYAYSSVVCICLNVG